MTETIKQRMTYEVDPETIFAMYLDEGFVREKNERTGGRDVEVEVNTADGGGCIVTSRRLPAKLPSFARQLTGDEISLTQTDRWHLPAEDGSRTGTVKIEFHGLPMKATGTFKLSPLADGSECLVELELKASVPLIGRKIEKVAAEYVQKAVGAEERIGREWLAEHGPEDA